MIHVGLEQQVWGLFLTRSRPVLDQNQECSEHDWGMFWAWLRNVLSPNKDRVKQVWGWSEWGLKQDLFRTYPTGTTEMSTLFRNQYLECAKKTHLLIRISSVITSINRTLVLGEGEQAKSMYGELTDINSMGYQDLNPWLHSTNPNHYAILLPYITQCDNIYHFVLNKAK